MFNVDCYSKIIFFLLSGKKKGLRETRRKGKNKLKVQKYFSIFFSPNILHKKTCALSWKKKKTPK